MIYVKLLAVLLLLAYLSMPGICRKVDNNQVHQNQNQQIEDVQGELQYSQNNLALLNTAVSQLMMASIEGNRRRIASHEAKCNLKRKPIYLSGQHDDQTYYKRGLPGIMELHMLLDAEIKSVENICTVPDVKESIPSDFNLIISYIQSFQFVDAERELIRGDYGVILKTAIHQIYTNDVDRFESILKFAKKLLNIDITLEVLKALWNELKTSGETDINKQLQLIDVVRDHVTDQPMAWRYQKKAAQNILKSICAEKMKPALVSFKGDKYVENMIYELKILQCDNLEEIVPLVIDDIYKVMNKTELLRAIYRSNKFIPNTINALVYVYQKMKESHDQNDPALFSLTDYFWNSSVTEVQKQQMSKAMSEFPESLRTLYFAPKKVCFKNAKYREYMYAGEPTYDKDRRHVLTWAPGDKDDTGEWMAQKPNSSESSNVFVFRNVAHFDEYLFVAAYDHSPEYRHVFTWVPGGIADYDNKGKLQLELHENGIAMKSIYYDNYLCSTTNYHSTNRRYVLSSNSESNGEVSTSCQWVLEDC